MSTILAILLIVAMIATLVALVRGIIAFLQTAEADLKDEGPGMSSLKQNRMMKARILFQALAIFIVVLLLALTQRG